MDYIKVIDGRTGKKLLNFNSVKQAEQAIFSLERADRHTGDFTPSRYVVICNGYRADRLNKQARRAFETQEV